jgi:predicted metal-dependent enzyme (double-stranded beta helix superfamily)
MVMTETNYSVQEYVEDLKRTTAEETDEKAIFKRLAPLAQKLAATPGWVTDTYHQCDEEQGFGVHVLYEEDDAKPGYADLEQGTEAIMTAGKVSCMLSGDIHTVWNVSDDISLSLHTYGKHVNFTDRSQFDPEAKSAEPFLLTVE